MADDWQPGDLALCVDDSECPIYGGCEVVLGDVYIVLHVKTLNDIYGLPHIGLKLDRGNPLHPITGSAGYQNAIRFIKAPNHLPDAEDRETIALLNGKPALVPVAIRAGMGEPM